MTPVTSSVRGEHVGITIMRERADRLAGTLHIESDAGEGTRVNLTFAASASALPQAAGGQ